MTGLNLFLCDMSNSLELFSVSSFLLVNISNQSIGKVIKNILLFERFNEIFL
jgi:hypothetical protein